MTKQIIIIYDKEMKAFVEECKIKGYKILKITKMDKLNIIEIEK